MKTILKPNAVDSLKILFIEDEEIIIDIYKFLQSDLTDQGYNVMFYIFDNPKDATNIIRTNKIDIVFCDLWMSGCNGLNFLAENMIYFQNTKLYLVTGEIFLENKINQKISLIEKPFDINDIKNKILNLYD